MSIYLFRKKESDMKIKDIKLQLTDRQKTFMLIILFILGIILLVWPAENEGNVNDGTKLVSTFDYKSSLENQLADMLGDVSGVGEVKVMITLKGENSKTIAYNENKSVSVSSTANREDSSKDAVLVRDSTGSVPYTLNEDYPEVAGVLVVTAGADDPLIKSYIISAVKSTLNVGANNITVLPMSSKK